VKQHNKRERETERDSMCVCVCVCLLFQTANSVLSLLLFLLFLLCVCSLVARRDRTPPLSVCVRVAYLQGVTGLNGSLKKYTEVIEIKHVSDRDRERERGAGGGGEGGGGGGGGGMTELHGNLSTYTHKRQR
jgi:uncharacterized membrane protein YgcG